MLRIRGCVLAPLLTAPMSAAIANVIIDWDEKVVSIVQPGTVFPPATTLRATAMLHIAMFDAVNSIEPRYRPYKVQISATPDTSTEAAAASAAGTVLIKLIPNAASNTQSALTSYLGTLPDGEIQRHQTGAGGRRADP